MPGRQSLPETLKRSPAKAQRTWVKAHDSAIEQYGEGASAHRVAYSALKHSFKKEGDHWVAKDQRGPSDPRAKRERPDRSGDGGATYRGVDIEGSRKALYEQAKKLGVRGRSKMNKEELARAVSRK